MIDQVEIYSQEELDRECEKREFPNCICISIGNPHWFFRKATYSEQIPASIKQRFPKLLRMEFFDEVEIEKIPFGRPKRLPKRKDIRKIIGFFKKYEKQYEKVIIHCRGGVSRSTATGICILYLIHKNQDKVLEIMKSIRPYAVPNKLMLKMIDEELGTRFENRNLEIMKDWKSRIHKRLENKK